MGMRKGEQLFANYLRTLHLRCPYVRLPHQHRQTGCKGYDNRLHNIFVGGRRQLAAGDALDCGEQNITTTVEIEGNVVTVVEHVGEQGLTDCICLYDNSFTINNLPQGEFTLRIKVESLYAGTPHQTTVFEETITQETITHQN